MKLRKIFWFVFFLPVVITIYPGDAFAQPVKHTAPGTMVDYSLRSMMSSARSLADRNQWLRGEIEILTGEIDRYKKELHGIDAKKQQFLKMKERPSAREELGNYSQQKWLALKDNLGYMRREHDELVRRYRAKVQNLDSMKSTVSTLENETRQFSRHASQEESPDFSQPTPAEHITLQEIQAVEESMEETRREIGRLVGDNTSMSRRVNAVDREHDELVRQVAQARDRLAKLRAAEATRRERIARAVAEQSDRKEALETSIKELKLTAIQVQSILARADSKLEAAPIDKDYQLQLQTQLSKNLERIRKENRHLQEEVSLLRRQADEPVAQ